MYKLPHYTETNKEDIISFIKNNPFAIISGIGETFPVATHVPLSMEERGGKIFLYGHIMKKTDHHISFEKNNNVLAIFIGAHCFVSADWYTNPAQGSTWNYMTVHCKGKIYFGDEQQTINAVQDITKRFVGDKTNASFDKLSDEYINSMVKAIVGFTIEVENYDAVFKLSQNRDEASKKNIIEQLIKRGDENSIKIAKEIERRM